ncbi:MAG: IucA/IucC family C-terminal-domain containing protein, partial [Actinocatenispora sp.]
MTSALIAAPARPLDPVRLALRRLRADRATFGVTDGLLTLGDPAAGWLPATSFVDGSLVPDLLRTPRLLWDAQPHAAAALAFKQYTYWLAMPAVLGWAVARRVPLMSAENVAVRLADRAPYVTVGMLRPRVAVLPDDPLAGRAGTVVAESPATLLDVLRGTLLDRHVAPLVEATRRQVRVGAHTLYGQLAAAVTYVLAGAAPILPGSPVEAADQILDALGMAQLAKLEDDGGVPTVRRGTCCLAFVAPGLRGRVCADCC